ncbi:MAG: IPT/TIG domain-containing protein [Fodinibius sp.]|nr:IPT/TIG domain-containing protein [Fodinibius sp.]
METEVPQGATDGPIKVTVKQKSTTGPNFNILAPTIESVNPDTAVVGTVIQVKGNYFSDQLSRNKVSFGGIVADVDSASGNKLFTTVPRNATGGPVKVLIGERSSDGMPFEVITTLQACYGNDVQLDATLEWVSQGLTTSDKDDKSQDMAMDSNGNLYMVLRDRGVVAKYDSNGDEVWKSNFNDKLPSTTWRGIEVDGNSVYIVGERGLISDQNLGKAKLDYHFSTLNSGNADAGAADPILAKLDAGSGSLRMGLDNWTPRILMSSIMKQ